MVTKSPIMLLTAALALIAQSFAAPTQNANDTVLVVTGNPKVDAEWTKSKFLQCVEQNNGMLSAGVIDDDIALRCRGVYSISLNATSLNSRNLPSTYEKPDTKSCDQNLPHNFEEAGPFRAVADTICNDLIENLMDKGLNHITHTFPDAREIANHSWLYKNRKAILETTMSLTPQTRSALKAGKVAKATLESLCDTGLKEFGTKGQGCTKEVHYYKKTFGIPHEGIPFDHAQTTGVKNGAVDLFVNNAKDFFGTINLSWSKP